MVKIDFEFYSKLNISCLVISAAKKILFQNTKFIADFSNIDSISRFGHKFNFDICVLDNADLSQYDPINAAIASDEDFYASVTYQSDKNKIMYFELNAHKQGKNTILLFNNITGQVEFEKLEKDFNKIKQQHHEINTEHKKFIRLEHIAQEQAAKMSLINKISNQIRNSINIEDIIDSALNELLLLFGGFKAYYAAANKEEFQIEHVSPGIYENLLKQTIRFDKNIDKSIRSNKYNISECLKDFAGAGENYEIPIKRIIIPIFKTDDLLGIIVVLTKQKITAKSATDVIDAVSAQLATGIVQASLFKQLNDKNIELEKTLEELKETQLLLINSEKMASLGQLVAGVAHEINTPLASINSNNSIIKKLIDTIDKEKADSKSIALLKEICEIDKEAISRISKIVKSLKKFVRLDEEDRQEADINNEIDLTLNLIKHEIKDRIEIVKNYKKIPLIKCYPNMLNQVFMNILMNACQSIPKKGTITVSTDFKKSELIVSIKDTGAGMDKNTMNNIFNIGFTTKGVGVGTGLGLAITHKIIEKHNGTIIVKSTPNKGSEFIITIPAP